MPAATSVLAVAGPAHCSSPYVFWLDVAEKGCERSVDRASIFLEIGLMA
jgi:hypothetical protein